MDCKKKPINIYQGFGTKWDNNDLLTVSFDSEIDINGFGAEFIIGNIVKSYTDIENGFSVNLTASETATLSAGPICGTLVLIDLENNKRPFSTELPFIVKDWAGGDIELDGFNISINSKVESNDLVINISTKNPLAINEETIRAYISLHNQSEEAHPYIRDLISAEVLAREAADSELSDRISANTAKFDNYRTSADQDVIDDTFETKSHANSTFATKTELENGLEIKQDKLTAGAAINITSNNVIENMGVRDISTGATNGTISINKGGSRSEVSVAGLDSAAYTPASDYATAAQGALADTALQSGDNVSELVNDSDYATNTEVEIDISNHNTSELAHSYIQGLISSEVSRAEGVEGQLSSLNTDSKTNLVSAINEVDGHADTNTSNIGTLSGLSTDAKNNLVAAINEVDSHVDTNTNDIAIIESKIPEQATSSNQLADKSFVNSSIATNTANFIGTFNSVAELEAYSGPLTNNDYAFVIGTDSEGNTVYDRYKYTDATIPASWVFEYELNNSSFTANQWAAINSGATTTNIGQITTNQNAIGTLSSLTTTAKNNLVAAINELDSTKIDGNTAITGATKCKITYDSKGLVTGGADLQASDIPSLTLSKISDVTATATEINVLDGVTASTSELNILDGVTATTAEINVLDGITATTTELNYTDGVTSNIQTQLNSKAVDSDVVHKAGTETITGQKTFSNQVYHTNEVYAKGGITLGTSTNTWGKMVQFQDTNGTRIGRVQPRAKDTTNNSNGIYVNNATNTTEQGLEVHSEGYATCPTPSSTSDNSSKIATTAWCNNFTNGMRSNCITEIPQDIKLELSSGTLTLKTGSKVYVPNGSGVFNKVTTYADYTFTYTTNGQYLLVLINSNQLLRCIYPAISDSSEPNSPSTGTLWYDTTNNLCKRWGGTAWAQVSFPFAIFTVSGGAISSIDQMFNGFGYIGSTVFALPDVKGLIPNGRNADGTLKNTPFEYTQVRLYSVTGTNTYYIRCATNYLNAFQLTTYYDENKNRVIFNDTEQNMAMCGTFSFVNGKITSLNPKTVFHAVDYNDAVIKDANNTFTGSNTFSGAISLGGSAIATTPAYSDNDTSVATTAWGYSMLNAQRANCITSIPQDIKLELSSDTLTLKAGSKVYAPNGSGTFDVVTVASDIRSGNISGIDVDYMFFLNLSGTIQASSPVSICYSGASAPSSPSTGWFWYDTTNNSVKRWSGSAWVGGFSLPFCIVKSGASSIKQTFNGFGYIGSTIFILPDVKGLIPNGRNEDGTLKNTPFTVSNVLTASLTGTNTDIGIWVGAANLNLTKLGDVESSGVWAYHEDTNLNMQTSGVVIRCLAGTFDITSSAISNFNPKTVFHAVDYNNFEQINTNISVLDAQNVKLTGNQSVAGNKTFTGSSTFSGSISLGSSATATTQSAGDNSTKVATTAYADTAVSNKIQLVSSLPVSPVAGVLYLIPE